MAATAVLETNGGVVKQGGFTYPGNDGAHVEIAATNPITFTGTAGDNRTTTTLDPATGGVTVYVNDVQVYPAA